MYKTIFSWIDKIYQYLLPVVARGVRGAQIFPTIPLLYHHNLTPLISVGFKLNSSLKLCTKKLLIGKHLCFM